jgi:hypothetical protein
MLNLKNTRNILFIFVFFTVVFFIYSDRIVTYLSSLSPLLVLFFSIFISPIYVLFIISLYNQYSFKGALAGYIISLGVDCISIPHIFTKSGELSTASLNLYTDSVFWGLMPQFLKDITINIPYDGQVNLAVFLIYIVFPISLIIIALMIATGKKFPKIFKDSI